MSSWLTLRNAVAVPAQSIPRVALEDFRQAIIAAPSHNRRVVALYGRSFGAAIELCAVLACDRDGQLEVARAIVEGRSFPSMTPDCAQVHLFERELGEQWGLVAEGHPWWKPVRFHKSYRPAQAGQAGQDAWGGPADQSPTIGVTNFYRIGGEEIHEVSVGPVHAGVIEPGHFRFQCHGEHVFHLEISLGYQHRGIEKTLVGGPSKRTIHHMETLAGDTTIGHSTAYCQAVEALAGCRPSARAHAIRAIALELERLANHTGDLGALAGDIGYLPTASFCGRLRGDFLNITALLCGNRFGRGIVRPGGVAFDMDAERVAKISTRLEAAFKDVEGAAKLLWQTGSVQARFEDVGRVSKETAAELGMVGPAARASGLRRDVRTHHPFGIFQFVHIPISTFHTGDVYARAFLRWLEIERSVVFLRAQLRQLPGGVPCTTCAPAKPDSFCVSLVEGWRGEICHVAETDSQGRFSSYKVVDPSFHNWTGLAMSLRNQQISDFPICNKSFNLSYCGHDL
jgi:Ni,Fe-hydrogenase III large subunit